MKKLLITILILAGATVVTAVAWNPFAAKASDSTSDDLLAHVNKGNLTITLTENGRLMAKESQVVYSKVRNEAKITFLIEEGKLVKKGDMVVQLDTATLVEQVEKLDLDILQAKADHENAVTEKEIQVDENQGNIEKAKFALVKARKELEQFVDGTAEQKRRELNIKIKNSSTSLQKKQEQFENSEKLFADEYIRKTERDQHELEYDSAKIQLESDEIALQLYEKFDYPIELANKNVAVSDAERGLRTAEKRSKSQLRQKEVAVEKFQDQLGKLEKQRKEKSEEVENMTLSAPCDGIVIHGDPKRPWWDPPKVGSFAYRRHPLVTIPLLDIMIVKIQIHEADIAKVQPGLKVKVTTETYPDVSLDGEITKVAVIANQRDETGIKKFDVEITLEKPKDLDIKPGISAKA